MIQFISQNSETINAITNVGVLLVWLIYAQLLYLNFARQRKPKIIVNQAEGYDLDSVCLISNMSAEAIYLECILLVIIFSDHSLVFNVTERMKESEGQSDEQYDSLTRQGPLSSGEFSSIGKFRGLIDRVAGKGHIFSDGQKIEDAVGELQGVEIRIIADYGPDRYPVGSSKKFLLEKNERGQIALYPESFYTIQVRGIWAKYHVIPKWFDACTNKYFP